MTLDDGRILLDLIGHDIYMTDVGLIPYRIRSQVDLTSQQLDTHEHDRSVKSTRLLHSLSNSPTLLSPIHNGMLLGPSSHALHLVLALLGRL